MSSPGTAYRIYREERDHDQLPVRLVLSYIVGVPNITGTDADLEEAMLSSGLRTGFGDDWMQLGAIKIILDGVWGTTAAVYKPVWKGSGTTWIANNLGGVSRTQEVLNKQILDAHKAGWQVWVHANGDRAQDMVLNAIEAAQKSLSTRGRAPPHRTFRALPDPGPSREPKNVWPACSATTLFRRHKSRFLWRLTSENLKEPDVKFFPMATLIKLGFHPPGGSDTLGTQNFATNPLFSISVAVNRKTKYGEAANPGGVHFAHGCHPNVYHLGGVWRIPGKDSRQHRNRQTRRPGSFIRRSTHGTR